MPATLKLLRPILIQPEIRSNTATVKEVKDIPHERRLMVSVELQPGHFKWVTVWQGEEYDKIGQWTDDQMLARLKKELEALP